MGGEARRFCENETGMAKEASGSEEKRERERGLARGRKRKGRGRARDPTRVVVPADDEVALLLSLNTTRGS